ncbi:MAG: nicotinamide riboside transporter PnuC [Mucilaginibacter sp.]|uniref:nicotinamide riboside transporter PnuC n=1 Tax=Mucilaginibacter sp. TaxID=1882438 RepID=UPI003265ED6D
MDITKAIETWWAAQSTLEVVGVITGLLCVYLAARNNIWNWSFAIVSVGIYIFIFWDSKLYADMGLQFYFMVMNIYGWYFWSRKPKTEAKTPVLKITHTEVSLSIAAVIVFTGLLGILLKKNTDAAFPFIDSFCTACSLVAQVFLARKVLENWLIWIFVDVIYVGVYSFKHLNLTALMYAIYIAIALMGYLDWRKDYRKQQTIQA